MTTVGVNLRPLCIYFVMATTRLITKPGMRTEAKVYQIKTSPAVAKTRLFYGVVILNGHSGLSYDKNLFDDLSNASPAQ